MKKVIRTGVFETNSSGIHSIIISKEGLRPNQLKIEDGVIYTRLKDWSSGGCATTQEEKLCYLISLLWARKHYDSSEDLYNDYKFQNIDRVIQKYTGCLRIDVDWENSDTYYYLFDHDIITDGYDVEDLIDVYDEDEIINFIFNDYISVNCWFTWKNN